MLKSREENIATLEWTPVSPYFRDVPSIDHRLRWLHAKPSAKQPDMKSMVVIREPASKYSDQELQRIAEFSSAISKAEQDRYGKILGANLIFLDKATGIDEELPWIVGRMNTLDPYRRKTLEEALLAADEKFANLSRAAASTP